MNSNQKIAQLRTQLEDNEGLWRQLETRVRDSEKQMTLLFVAMLMQIIMYGAAVYSAITLR